uniref:Uncharacterized protein n=1 Tax=Aegilops tauschii subsp. strangulata TaxID=200361 RepID=A0A453LTI3_AEGTS
VREARGEVVRLPAPPFPVGRAAKPQSPPHLAAAPPRPAALSVRRGGQRATGSREEKGGGCCVGRSLPEVAFAPAGSRPARGHGRSTRELSLDAPAPCSRSRGEEALTGACVRRRLLLREASGARPDPVWAEAEAMSAAGEDIVQHLSSNSNPSSSKLAKLEARMAGKAVSVPPPSPPHHPVVSAASAPTFMDQEELPESSSSSDDDNGEEFLIQKNTLKRPRSPDDDHGLALGNFEGSANAAAKVLDVTDTRLPSENPSRKRQGRGRGRGGTGRGRGSKTVDQTRHTSASSVTVSNGQHDKLTNMDSRTSVLPGNDDRTALHEELSLLRGKVAFLEEELNKSRQEATEHHQLSDRLAKELKDFKDQDQQKKPKQMKVLSDLLIAVSKAERQEARMKLKQESFRLGNIGVMRAGTVISETWEDGQAIKDLNAHLKSLLETKEAVERHRKSLKKRQSSG